MFDMAPENKNKQKKRGKKKREREKKFCQAAYTQKLNILFEVGSNSFLHAVGNLHRRQTT